MIQKYKELNIDLVNAPSLYKIIYIQKMTFEQARLEKNYDIMRSALQNILDNLINKANKEQKEKQLKQIMKALSWYDTLQYNKEYIKKLSTGERIYVFPDNIKLKVEYCMTYSYRNLNKLVEDLNII